MFPRQGGGGDDDDNQGMGKCIEFMCQAQLLTIYSQPSISTGSTLSDSTNRRSKILGGGERARKFQKSKT